MTNESLAMNLLEKAKIRLNVLPVLMELKGFSDVVREAQEIVELALKAMLRHAGIEPPKWHDVGPALIEFADRFPEFVQSELPRLAGISSWLRKERELSFYGDVDFMPTKEYTREHAERAVEDAEFTVQIAERWIGTGH
jgi:HEPN domain-containing protein